MRVIPSPEIGFFECTCREGVCFFRWVFLGGFGGRSQQQSRVRFSIETSHDEVRKFLKTADQCWLRLEFLENPELLARLAGIDVTKMIDSQNSKAGPFG